MFFRVMARITKSEKKKSVVSPGTPCRFTECRDDCIPTNDTEKEQSMKQDESQGMTGQIT